MTRGRAPFLNNMDILKIYYKKILRFRRDLDKIAELSWQEEKTKKYIIKNLGKDYYWTKKTAVIYKIGCGIPVFFRAELDALPTRRGPRHVCGHSAHSAALMGAYLYFKKHPVRDFAVYFVFQPSEESFPSGADFISKNFKEINKCRAGFGFHVLPNFRLGELASPVFAAGDYFEIRITGRSGHIKDKNKRRGGDAILIAGKLAKKINADKKENFVINVGLIKGGEAPNKIAGSAFLAGDVRTLAASGSVSARLWLSDLCHKLEKQNFASKVNLRYCKGYPLFRNDKKIFEKIKKIFRIKKEVKTFGTEDFSMYRPPKIFLLIGVGKSAELHTDKFYVRNGVITKLFEYWVKIINNLEIIVGL